MNNYEQLKSVIQAANPEIMELKFGCEVLWTYDHALNGVARTPITKHGYCTHRSPTNYDSPLGEVDVLFDGNKRSVIKPFGELKILGRPIRLADVVLAYHSVRQTNGNWFANDWEKFFYPLLQANQGWNLKDDNLDHQSDECKEFLANLLVTSQTDEPSN